MNIDSLIIRKADWVTDNQFIKEIRKEVFINEQQVPEKLEWDSEDSSALHCLAILNNIAIATGRLQQDGQLGRMAVIKEFRHKGIGSKVLQYLIDRQQLSKPIFIHAQKHAMEFYKIFNFEKDGNEFMEAGIPHYLMTLRNDNK